MIFDTDVLIWCLRGQPRAARAIERQDQRALSIVSTMELLQGARDRRELSTIRSFLADMRFRTLPLTEAIGQRAAINMEEHALGSGLTLADALVAATAIEAGDVLCSGNSKHFRIIKELDLKPFKVE